MPADSPQLIALRKEYADQHPEGKGDVGSYMSWLEETAIEARYKRDILQAKLSIEHVSKMRLQEYIAELRGK